MVRLPAMAALLAATLLASGGCTNAPAESPDAWPQAARAIVDPESGRPYLLERSFVPSGEHRIAAQLLRPADATRAPVVVLVSGSGSGLLPAEGPLSRRLLAQGYAVLALGKKGVGASSGSWRRESFEDRAANVRAALDWLGARADVDGSRVVLYGHSQGGYVIPLLAGEPRVAAYVISAGPAEVVRDQIATERYERALREGIAPGRARAAADRDQRLLDLALAGCGLVRYHYLCRIYRFDPEPHLRRLRAPVLVLLGANDPLVPPSRNEAALRGALAANPDAHFAVLPRANHMLWESRSGLPEEYAELAGPPVRFARAIAGDPDHERLARQHSNRVRMAAGYYEAVDAFVARYVPTASRADERALAGGEAGR